MASLHAVGADAPGLAAPERLPNEEAPGVMAGGFENQRTVDSQDSASNGHRSPLLADACRCRRLASGCMACRRFERYERAVLGRRARWAQMGWAK